MEEGEGREGPASAGQGRASPRRRHLVVDEEVREEGAGAGVRRAGGRDGAAGRGTKGSCGRLIEEEVHARGATINRTPNASPRRDPSPFASTHTLTRACFASSHRQLRPSRSRATQRCRPRRSGICCRVSSAASSGRRRRETRGGVGRRRKGGGVRTRCVQRGQERENDTQGGRRAD